ncbi:MAG: large-conductance mechanosensitive channel protein MscL [Eubacteriales bacterium]|nr:large-conductance mechanosensitive channel protein MscL [Eubacteriales bacterium]MDY3332332.1 large-conductance mechanosensitive channel protein MscL [Gallibacter sp.]
MIKEFKTFIMKGNVIDLAVGVVIGAAFGAIVNSLVNDIIMPIVSLLTGKIDFTNMFIAMDGNTYQTLAEAKAATSVIAYGNFIQQILQFLIIGFSIFLVVKGINKMRKSQEEAAPTTKVCPFCKSDIHLEAVKCPNCASSLEV